MSDEEPNSDTEHGATIVVGQVDNSEKKIVGLKDKCINKEKEKLRIGNK